LILVCRVLILESRVSGVVPIQVYVVRYRPKGLYMALESMARGRTEKPFEEMALILEALRWPMCRHMTSHTREQAHVGLLALRRILA